MLIRWTLVLLAGLFTGGCCLELRISPCCSPCESGKRCGQRECRIECGRGGAMADDVPLPSTPLTIVELRNKQGSGKRIVGSKVRGRSGGGTSAPVVFAPPPQPPSGTTYTGGWYPFPTQTLPDDGSSTHWSAGSSAPPETVRNVELELKIEESPGVNRTVFLEVTSASGCGEATPYRRLNAVVVELTAYDATTHMATFDVHRTWYTADNVNGCGPNGETCDDDLDTCTVAAQ